jgi:hypothetical protein
MRSYVALTERRAEGGLEHLPAEGHLFDLLQSEVTMAVVGLAAVVVWA